MKSLKQVLESHLYSGCDTEAVHVMHGSPKWISTSQRGKAVRQRMVLPISFVLNSNNASSISVGEVSRHDFEFTPSINKKIEDGVLYLSGKVKYKDGSALPGTNIVMDGTTVGTITSLDVTFQLISPITSGKLVFSFVGFKTKEISF